MNKKILSTTLIALVVIITVATASMSLMTFGDDELILSGGKTTISVDKSEIDLGTIKQGVPKLVTFKVTNSGDIPLVIYDVETSCGCTGAEWSKKPIEPKKQQSIVITYDAKETGQFIKTITVYGNIETGSKQLQIKGAVEY